MFAHTVSVYPNNGKVSAENKSTKTDWKIKRRSPLGLGVFTSLPLLLGLACPAAWAELPEYIITDLGTLGGVASDAIDINNSGQVVGGANLEGDKAFHAFLWTPGEGMRDLGALGGRPDADSEATAINENGQVVGFGDIDDVSDYHSGHAFLWTPEKGIQDLGVLGGAYDEESGANDISPDGQVVGYAATENFGTHAFHWKDGVMQNISKDPNSSEGSNAYSINAHGEVATSDGIWTAAEGLRTLPDGFAPWHITDDGRMLGSKCVKWLDWGWGPECYSHHSLFRTAEGEVHDLGTLEEKNWKFVRTSAHDINASNQIVGAVSDYPGSDELAFLWTPADGLQDLNDAPGVKDSDWELEKALAINDAGQIVGRGRNPDYHNRAYLLTPVKLKCQGRLPTVIGTKGNDVLKGTKGRDVIQGGDGNDVIKAGGGNDIVCGGPGNDKLYGGAGKNQLAGGSGKDTCKQGVKSSGCER
jgi:probable HAF family extracellular repeat protein